MSVDCLEIGERRWDDVVKLREWERKRRERREERGERRKRGRRASAGIPYLAGCFGLTEVRGPRWAGDEPRKTAQEFQPADTAWRFIGSRGVCGAVKALHDDDGKPCTAYRRSLPARCVLSVSKRTEPPPQALFSTPALPHLLPAVAQARDALERLLLVALSRVR